jgi:hypothetical protein
MESIAIATYPQVVWRAGEKMLWNTIHRKPLKNLPEERVRLRVIEFLIRSGWSKHRISTEESIGKLADTGMRTDIICYNQQFEPRILIECKAEYVPITEDTARQAARYNQHVEAPYLLLTNGVSDFWYKMGGQKVEKLDNRPPGLPESNSQSPQNFEYWRDRGFAGEKASPNLRKWFMEVLPEVWDSRHYENIRYLSFNQELSDLNLSHYYYVSSLEEGRRLAFSTLTTAYGGSRMTAILNEKNKNRAVLEINLDLLFDERSRNATVYSDGGPHLFDLSGFFELSKLMKPFELSEQLLQVIEEHAT